MTGRSTHDGDGVLEPRTLRLLSRLNGDGVSVVIYGSQGVALHLGRFKEPGDLDLLVDDEWLGHRCDDLTAIMGSLGFWVSDPNEHAYRDESGFEVAFAARSILERDGVVVAGEDAFVTVRVAGHILSTLTPTAFRRAYAFSARDGYRRDKRGKNDARVIALLDAHLARPQAETGSRV